MNRVQQEHIDGCAAACLAMVTGTDYTAALQTLHPEGGSWTSNEDLLVALKAAGFEINVRIPCPLEQLNDAILVVRYPISGTNFMHVVVWDAKRKEVLDPWEARPQESYQRDLCLVFELG